MCVKEKIHCLLIGKSCKRSGAVVVEDLIKTNELIILGSRLMMKRELNSHPKIGKKVVESIVKDQPLHCFSTVKFVIEQKPIFDNKIIHKE